MPALAFLGPHEFAQISIEYVALPDLLRQVVVWPVMVNVVPGDAAAACFALKSMAEDITLQSRGRDDKERRTRKRSKRDSLA